MQTGFRDSAGNPAQALLDASGSLNVNSVSSSSDPDVVTGTVASHAADSGNPVKVGGKYTAAGVTLDDGDRGDLGLDSKANVNVNLNTQLARAQDSVTNWPVNCNATIVDLATDADVVVSANPAALVGIYVNVVFSAHVVNLIDNVTTQIILPASLAAGTLQVFPNITFATNLSVNSNDAATGTLVVLWRAL